MIIMIMMIILMMMVMIDYPEFCSPSTYSEQFDCERQEVTMCLIPHPYNVLSYDC